MPRPLAKKQKLAPGSEHSISVSLKSLRNPPLDITLPSLSPNTSILDLKTSIQEQTSIPVSKLRVLYAKKPVPDSKVLKDVLGDGQGEGKLEFSVMVIGGAAAVMKKGEEEVEPVVAMGNSEREVLDKEEFWGDLRGFLVQRLRDEGERERVWSVFRGAWEKENGR
jgi:hypothetical protein